VNRIAALCIHRKIVTALINSISPFSDYIPSL
jgi:hypothetical protein